MMCLTAFSSWILFRFRARMFPRAIRAAAMTLGLFSSLCVSCNADAAVKIAVSGQTVEVEVSPRSATYYSQYHLEYLIRKDGTVLTGPYIRQLGKVGKAYPVDSGDLHNGPDKRLGRR